MPRQAKGITLRNGDMSLYCRDVAEAASMAEALRAKIDNAPALQEQQSDDPHQMPSEIICKMVSDIHVAALAGTAMLAADTMNKRFQKQRSLGIK